MKALVQRVSQARVEVDGTQVAATGRGFLVLLGVERGDTDADLDHLVRKVANLRVFPDGEGRMNLSLLDIGGEALVVSQFTLAADTAKGKRPSFGRAEEPERARMLYERFMERLEDSGVRVAGGQFATDMAVTLTNQGPVTIMLESRRGPEA